ncbi:malate synthase [Shewanella zhangzhouensis]|uniref:malate synthase n=1 Tax=Shewanella zhangzhouensis TaxID=2864213 RepID=UPI001C65AF27|nr:malate synthase [Shewanella zhangzhouensis]QYK05973.1 malate synthase [Shewanella zhangzhouensis]
MNMTMMNTQNQQQLHHFIGEAIAAVVNGAKRGVSLESATEFLDRRFPLARGSHKMVKSYVVYYQHLLAFFEDGSHSGLEISSQFVALCGHKEEPCAILLKSGDIHVELTLDKNGRMGSANPAHIEDIQVESPGFCLRESEGCATEAISQCRNWLSLLHSAPCDDDCRQRNERRFTAKDGGEYQLVSLGLF